MRSVGPRGSYERCRRVPNPVQVLRTEHSPLKLTDNYLVEATTYVAVDSRQDELGFDRYTTVQAPS